MEGRDLTGLCGSCGYFQRLDVAEDGSSSGECRLGCWPSPLRDVSTCSSHKPIGQPFKPLTRGVVRTHGRRTPRADHPPDDARARLPQEIDLDMDLDDFRNVLRDVLREELGLDDTPIGERWKGGELRIVPGKDGTQPKSVPIDVFFKKIVGVREKLRVLEQKINANEHLPTEEKLALQGYITQCYGSMTTFNVLFRDRDDWFVGAGKDE